MGLTGIAKGSSETALIYDRRTLAVVGRVNDVAATGEAGERPRTRTRSLRLSAEGIKREISLQEFNSSDVSLLGNDDVEHAAFEPLIGQLGKETLDGIDSGGRGWREVENEAFVLPEPLHDLGMLVARVVIEHMDQLLIGTWFAIAFRKRMNS